jgi:iron(III) transport system substrate-binding protein
LVAAVASLAVVVGCSAAAQPNAPPAQPARENAAAATTNAPESAAESWEQIVAAAKREGKLAVYGPPDADIRDVLTLGFQRAYPEIAVEYTSGFGVELATKLTLEREAGQYWADLQIAGTTTLITAFMDAQALDPIRPFLVTPEAAPSKWMDDKLEFADNAEQYVLVFSNLVKAPFIYNVSLATAGDFRSWNDLLDPRWRGQMIMHDPRQAGAGLATGSFLYVKLGQPYLERLIAQGVAFTRTPDQLIEGVARGRYAIGIAHNETPALQAKAKGLPVEILQAPALAEQNYVTPGFGAIGVMNRAPHPNAIKVYLDYLLSREGQTAYHRAAYYISRRRDVPRDHLPEAMVPKEGGSYYREYREEWVRQKDQMMSLFQSLVGP